MEASIFSPGENCWKVKKAIRGDFLIDGEEYFSAIYRALVQAQKTIYITGWEINSHVRLVPSHKKIGHYSPELSKLVDRLAHERPDLRIYILVWNFAGFYVLEREVFPAIALDWLTHKHVRFVMDDQHPIGASQHQKFVVVDDQIAFCGGLDLTHRRWDTREHIGQSPVRIDHRERRYGPFHDVQMAVTGPAAAALGGLFRERWMRATGEKLFPPKLLSTETRFPLRGDFKNGRVGIARTYSPYKHKLEIREVERLYVDMIGRAKRLLYIETQYFTADAVLAALRTSLGSLEGPEVIIVLPEKAGGWLEENTMGVKQTAALDLLRAADHYHRLGIYYPYLPGLGENEHLTVHSKVMVADDELARIGSSNLTNRSMGLDSECDLVLEADSEANRMNIAHFRNRLLGEHLAATTEEIAAVIEAGRLREFIESRSKVANKRHLVPLIRSAAEPLSRAVVEFGDRRGPLPLDRLLDLHLVKRFRSKRHSRTGFSILIAAVLLLTAAALLWHHTSIHETVNPARIRELLLHAKESGVTFETALLFFVVLSIFLFPLHALTLAVATVFDAGTAVVCILLGMFLSATFTYFLGHWVGRTIIKRYFPHVLSEIKRHARDRKLVPIVLIRLVPFAPFSVVNLACGAAHYRFGYYIAGTLLAAVPGTIGLIFFQRSLLSALFAPNFLNISLVVLALGILIFGVIYLKKRISL